MAENSSPFFSQFCQTLIKLEGKRMNYEETEHFFIDNNGLQFLGLVILKYIYITSLYDLHNWPKSIPSLAEGLKLADFRILLVKKNFQSRVQLEL